MACPGTNGFQIADGDSLALRPIIIGTARSLTKAQMGNNRVSPSWSLRNQGEIPWFIMVTVDKP